jgi:hypothetical protein
MQSPTLTLVLIFTTILSLLTLLSAAMPLAVPQDLPKSGGGGAVLQVLPSEYVPPVDAAPGAPGLPGGGGSGGQSAGNIVIASGVLMEISLLVAGMGFWV